MLVLGAVGFFARASILQSAAWAWVVDEPLTKADAIVVLGGAPDRRAPEAARLYHQGLAPRILYMDVALAPNVELGFILPERELTRRWLLSNNVPESAITALGKSVSSTFEEAMTIQEWVKTNGAKSLIIPTDLFHTRRVRWLFRKKLKDTGAAVQVRAITPPRYNITNWWREEEGLMAFQNEVIKSAFYHLKY